MNDKDISEFLTAYRKRTLLLLELKEAKKLSERIDENIKKYKSEIEKNE